jgi:peptidyl-prolyl cis-trans isomerase SurA
MRIITLLIGLVGFTSLAHSQGAEIIDKVVVYVGDELVLLSEIEEQFQLMKDRQPTLGEELKCSVLENLMVQKLLVNQAKLDSVVILDEEVDLQLDARIDRILSMMGNDVEQFEAYYGKSISLVKEQFRHDLTSQILAERMQSQAMADIKVTPAEVVEFFNSIPKDSLPYFNAEVEISEISAKPQVNEVERKKAYDRLEKLRTRIEEGESFETLAGQFSDDPGSARNGGDLGWMKRGSLVPEYEAEAYNLKDGEIGEIVESEFGLHLIQMIGRRGNTIHTRHILIKPEITQADVDKTIAYLDSVKMVIEKDSITFSKAVQMFSDKKSSSYSNGGRLTNPATGNTFFEIGDLDPDIYFTIDTMSVGEVSVPIEYENFRGEKAYRIIQMLSYTDPHRANLQQDYFKIQKAAIEQKRSSQFINWIKAKAGVTFVKVESPYKTCPNLVQWEKEN